VDQRPAIVFCSDALRPSAVDEHFAGEARAVRDLGGTVLLLDHDALLGGDLRVALRRFPDDAGPCWYRGWMMPAACYGLLEEGIAERGGSLVVTSDRFRAAHELPGWYPAFAAVTAESAWHPWQPGAIPGPDEVQALSAELGGGPAIVKDYVKSRKAEWAEACFVPDLADTDTAGAVVRRMVELQGSALAGGIVVRRFEAYLSDGGRAAESRVWWVHGDVAVVTTHPDAPAMVGKPDLDAVGPAVRALGSPFVTTDMALRADGAWRVVEVGDGQVSDLPATADPAPLMRALLGAASV